MFTGIVQSVGEVLAGPSPTGRLVVRGTLPYEIPAGGSVSVNGCCLTHTGPPPEPDSPETPLPDPLSISPSSKRGGGAQILVFDLSEETLSRTTLGSLALGSRINLEAALRAGDPMGGHFVQGHVDAAGEFLSREGETFRFRAQEDGAVFLADKGSIAVDGVSLTIVKPAGPEFSVALIRHTLEATTLGQLEPGGRVNLEYDVLARYALGRLATDD